MYVERLEFNNQAVYNPTELTMHMARYLFAKHICKELNVLDVACGEGFGSFLMGSLWGAKSVRGVDISSQAIESARQNFQAPNIEYFCYSAEKITDLFDPQSFDLIVSFETIEHLKGPGEFLQGIRQLLKPGGVIIISCPNDHWYHGQGKSKNPFHERAYYFEEFKNLAEKYLGVAEHYFLGKPLSGFGNFPLDNGSSAKYENQMIWALSNFDTVQAGIVPNVTSYSPDDSLYYIGAWGNLNNQVFEHVLYQSLEREQYFKELIEAREWSATQIDNWKTLAEERHEYIQQLIEGKQWLETQVDNWKTLAEERHEYIQQLIEGKQWLETQVDNLKRSA